MKKQYSQAQIDAIKTDNFLLSKVAELTEDLNFHFQAGRKPNLQLLQGLEQLRMTMVYQPPPTCII